MGCADPPSKAIDAPHQCPRVNQTTKWTEGSRSRHVPYEVEGVVVFAFYVRLTSSKLRTSAHVGLWNASSREMTPIGACYGLPLREGSSGRAPPISILKFQ